MSSNLINVDFPTPGFPLIHKNPWCSENRTGSSQLRYSGLTGSHTQVFVCAFLMFICRASSWSNRSELFSSCFCSVVGNPPNCGVGVCGEERGGVASIL